MSAPHAHPDHYAALGVPTTATARQITHAYRALVRALHPVGLEYWMRAVWSGDLMVRVCQAAVAVQNSWVSPPRTGRRRTRCSARLIGAGGACSAWAGVSWPSARCGLAWL